MRPTFWLTLTLALTAIGAPVSYAQQEEAAPQIANPQIDYDGFVSLTLELRETREARLISLDEFDKRTAQADTIVLDTRSAAAFQQGHIAGAINLPFSDFTADKLSQVLGANTDRQILIYCNNNFSDNIPPIMSKKAPLALNIPTFINLYGYGYTNIWELADVVSTADVAWVTPDSFAEDTT